MTDHELFIALANFTDENKDAIKKHNKLDLLALADALCCINHIIMLKEGKINENLAERTDQKHSDHVGSCSRHSASAD